MIHHASNRKRTVKMQSWKTAQKPIRPRSTRRLRRTTNCGKFSRTCQRNTGRFSTVHSMGCHGVSEPLMAAGATEEDVKKISQVMAQTVRRLESGIVTPEPGPEAHCLPCEAVGSDEEFSNEICIPGFSKMGTEGQEAIKRTLSNAITEKRRLAKKCKQEGQGLWPAPSLDLDPTRCGVLLSCAFQNW